LSNYHHMHTIDIDRAESEMEVQVEQVRKAYGGPQVISCVDTNLALDQDKPQCITPLYLTFVLN
jgi:hypothetical protein